MKKLNFIALVILLISYSNVLAYSHGVGNGGNAYVCYNNADHTIIESIDFFDYIEQQKIDKDNSPIDLGPSNLSVEKKIDIFIARYAVDYGLNEAKRLRNYARAIYFSLGFSSVINYNLPKINDYNTQFINNRSNCQVQQFAIQSTDPMTNNLRFLVDYTLFYSNKITNDVRVGLIMHEALYSKDIMLYSANDSDQIRKINYKYAKKSDDKITLKLNNDRLYQPLNPKFSVDNQCFYKDIYLNDNQFFSLLVKRGSPTITNIFVTCNDVNHLSLNKNLQLSFKAGSLMYPKYVDFNLYNKTYFFSIDSEDIKLTFSSSNTSSTIEGLNKVYIDNNSLYAEITPTLKIQIQKQKIDNVNIITQQARYKLFDLLRIDNISLITSEDTSIK